MSDCNRCTRPLATGDDYATKRVVSKLGKISFLFFHWECIRKDKFMALTKAATPYINYSTAPKKKKKVAA